VLEVGCGATGLVFFFDGGLKVGVDPLSDHYARLFPAWQGRAATAAAAGERLPFAEAAFDIVLCDNVVDHAENPREIVRELVRVLAPGGILYFTVHVHHRLYDAASRLHALWRALGLPLEVGPFADHTVHLSPAGARTLFAGLPIRILKEDDNVEKRRARSRWLPWKNGTYRLIATR
jgi:SAM-dependent methyltransferase